MRLIISSASLFSISLATDLCFPLQCPLPSVLAAVLMPIVWKAETGRELIVFLVLLGLAFHIDFYHFLF